MLIAHVPCSTKVNIVVSTPTLQGPPMRPPSFQRAPLTINTIMPNFISASCMGQGPNVPHTKFQKLMIRLFWIMIIAGAFISAYSEQTL